MKTTEWFPLSSPPARKGPYEVLDDEGERNFYSYFDGKKWHGEWRTVERAHENYPWPYDEKIEAIAWRGLTTKDGK